MKAEHSSQDSSATMTGSEAEAEMLKLMETKPLGVPPKIVAPDLSCSGKRAFSPVQKAKKRYIN